MDSKEITVCRVSNKAKNGVKFERKRRGFNIGVNCKWFTHLINYKTKWYITSKSLCEVWPKIAAFCQKWPQFTSFFAT